MRSSTSGFKRARTDNPPNPVPALTPEFSDPDASFQSSKTTPNNNLNGSSTFRNVSACNRCRLRKNRCDQNLPACSLCAKAGVRCVGFDPITKREIPRTYVYYLESRLNYLETLLADHGIPFAPSREFDLGAIPSTDQHQVQMSSSPALTHATKVPTPITTSSEAYQQPGAASGREKDEHSDLNELVSNISMASVQGVPDPRYLGTGSGMSFARYTQPRRLPIPTDRLSDLFFQPSRILFPTDRQGKRFERRSSLQQQQPGLQCATPSSGCIQNRRFSQHRSRIEIWDYD